MKVDVIAYFEVRVHALAYSEIELVIPKLLKIKNIISNDETMRHVYDINRIIKKDSSTEGKTKFFQYYVEIEDDTVLK